MRTNALFSPFFSELYESGASAPVNYAPFLPTPGLRELARAILDCGFYEFKRQLEYKSYLKGCQLVLVDRWFPSSQVCSDCGHKDGKKDLDVRSWTCSNCGEDVRLIDASHHLAALVETFR